MKPIHFLEEGDGTRKVAFPTGHVYTRSGLSRGKDKETSGRKPRRRRSWKEKGGPF